MKLLTGILGLLGCIGVCVGFLHNKRRQTKVKPLDDTFVEGLAVPDSGEESVAG